MTDPLDALQTQLDALTSFGIAVQQLLADLRVRLTAREQEIADLARASHEARDPERPVCSRCGGPHPFDTVIPSVLWNDVVRKGGEPDFLCPSCILEIFAAAGTSFTCELWGGPFAGTPISVHVNNRRARTAKLLSAENTDLRHRLAEAERACQGFRASLTEKDRIIEQLAGDVKAVQADYGDAHREAERLTAALQRAQALAHWEVGDDLEMLRTRLACIGTKCAAVLASVTPDKETPK